MTEPVTLLVDCDAGVDDLFGVALAAKHPRARLVGVSVVGGNVPTSEGASYVRTILDLVQRGDVPVLSGLAGGGAARRAGDPDAVAAVLRDAILAAEGPTKLVATGSLTNVAAVVNRFGTVLQERLDEIIFLGGAFNCPGNISELAERNVYSDAEAAQDVLKSGFRVTLVPINVSQTFTIPPEVADALARHETLLHDYLWTILGPLRSYYEIVFATTVCPIHDPLAVLFALNEELFEWEKKEVSVELKGEITRGVTVVDDRPEARASNEDSRIRRVTGVKDEAAAWREIAGALDLDAVTP